MQKSIQFMGHSMLVYWKFPPWVIMLAGVDDGLLISYVKYMGLAEKI